MEGYKRRKGTIWGKGWDNGYRKSRGLKKFNDGGWLGGCVVV